jgi:hypothetical protein
LLFALAAAAIIIITITSDTFCKDGMSSSSSSLDAQDNNNPLNSHRQVADTLMASAGVEAATVKFKPCCTI